MRRAKCTYTFGTFEYTRIQHSTKRDNIVAGSSILSPFFFSLVLCQSLTICAFDKTLARSMHFFRIARVFLYVFLVVSSRCVLFTLCFGFKTTFSFLFLGGFFSVFCGHCFFTFFRECEQQKKIVCFTQIRLCSALKCNPNSIYRHLCDSRRCRVAFFPS